MDEPILFYFYEHNYYSQELNTPTLSELINRSAAVFYEFVSPDLAWTGKVEANWNKCIRDNDLRSIEYTHPQGLTLIHHLQGTDKKLWLERSLLPDYDFNKLRLDATMAFFDATLERAYSIYEQYLSRDVPYNAEREKRVAKQILSLATPTAVVFGFGHISLAALLQPQRQIEIHFPYPNYPESFEVKLRQHYRKNGVMDRKLYHQSLLEAVALKAIREVGRELTGYEAYIVAYHYAEVFTERQVIRLRDNYLREMDKSESGTIGKVFNKFLRQQGFRSIPEMASDVLGRPSKVIGYFERSTI